MQIIWPQYQFLFLTLLPSEKAWVLWNCICDVATLSTNTTFPNNKNKQIYEQHFCYLMQGRYRCYRASNVDIFFVLQKPWPKFNVSDTRSVIKGSLQKKNQPRAAGWRDEKDGRVDTSSHLSRRRGKSGKCIDNYFPVNSSSFPSWSYRILKMRIEDSIRKCTLNWETKENGRNDTVTSIYHMYMSLTFIKVLFWQDF